MGKDLDAESASVRAMIRLPTKGVMKKVKQNVSLVLRYQMQVAGASLMSSFHTAFSYACHLMFKICSEYDPAVI